jgi:excisionase family DNA binding protein
MSISSVGNGDALLCTPNEAMATLRVSRATLYGLLNSGELESFTEGKSRKIVAQSLQAYIRRRLEAEAQRRGRVA